VLHFFVFLHRNQLGDRFLEKYAYGFKRKGTATYLLVDGKGSDAEALKDRVIYDIYL
jgi:hypothetical protein